MADIQPNPSTPSETTEEWRPVVGYEGIYSVSSLGRVRRDKKSRGVRKPTPYLLQLNRHNKKRGVSVGLCGNDGQKTRLVHHLVAEAFIGPRPEGHETNHLDGDTTNNARANLEYCTGLQNMAHAVANGLKSRGERNHTARLTEQDVIAIRAALDNGEQTRAQLAREYGMSWNNIAAIGRRETWRHLP